MIDNDDLRIDIFKKTYSSVYLEGIPEEKKQELKQTLNPVLQRIMSNLESPKTYMTEFIEGPVSFYKYKLDLEGKNTKTFYLFGEYHRETTDHCAPYSKQISIDFMEYIRRLSFETPSFIDLYAELPMLRSSKPSDKTNLKHYDRSGKFTLSAVPTVIKKMLNDENIDFHTEFRIESSIDENLSMTSQILQSISNDFLTCIQPSTRGGRRKKAQVPEGESKEDINCQLMRIHNVDVRSSFLTEDMNNTFYLHVMTYILGLPNENVDLNTKISLLRRLGYPLLKVLAKMACADKFDVNNFLKIATSNQNVKKEIGKTYMARSIMMHMRILFQQIVDLFPGGESIIRNLIIKLLDDSCLINIDETQLYMLHLFSMRINILTMDIYCLCRIFKTYEVSEGSFQPEENNHIIIYAGQLHIENYRSFLKYIGGVETFIYRKIDSNLPAENYKSCVMTTQGLTDNVRILIRFNRTLDIMRQKLDNKWKNWEISSEDLYNTMDSMIKEGNNRADELFVLSKNDSLTKDDFKRELDILSQNIDKRFNSLKQFDSSISNPASW